MLDDLNLMYLKNQRQTMKGDNNEILQEVKLKLKQVYVKHKPLHMSFSDDESVEEILYANFASYVVN